MAFLGVLVSWIGKRDEGGSEGFIIIFSIKYGEIVAAEGITGSLWFWGLGVLGIIVSIEVGGF